MNNAVAQSIKAALCWLEDRGFKTLDDFLRVLMVLVEDLYSGKITKDEFLAFFSDTINQQLTRAWYEGMRDNGLDPFADMNDNLAQLLQGAIDNEFLYMSNFADEILEKKRENDLSKELTGVALVALLAYLLLRAEAWVNRYNDVRNQAVLLTAKDNDKLIWLVGDTEKHCNTCKSLQGFVAYASEWRRAGIRPQNPPNKKLGCGGWFCDCSLRPTNENLNPNALGVLLSI